MPWDSEVRSASGWIQLPGEAGKAVARAIVPADRAGDELFVAENPGIVAVGGGTLDVNVVSTVTPSASMMQAEPTWTTLIDAIRIDNAPTDYNSAGMDVSDYGAVWVLCDVDSTLAPTHLRVIAQYSHDAGTTWWDYEEGLWASLGWEDTDTAAGINKAYMLACGGIDLIRIRIVGTGTDAGNFFDVTVLARAFYGHFTAGHA